VSLLLPGTQRAMVDAATAAAAATQTGTGAKKPVVVVVMGGSAVDLAALKASPAVDAIAWVGYPGQASGTAIATALCVLIPFFIRSPRGFGCLTHDVSCEPMHGVLCKPAHDVSCRPTYDVLFRPTH
jgi:hypothetical protein